MTKQEQDDARQILMRLPGMTSTVSPERDSRTVEGLLHALAECGQQLQRLFDANELLSQKNEQYERDIAAVRRVFLTAP